MTPYERLLAEELPTGDFGDGPALPTKRHQPRTPAAPKPDPNAEAHRAALLAALNGTTDHRTTRRRHLHAVPATRTDAA